MKANPEFNAHIIGHTSRTPISKAKFNVKLSKDRASKFRDELIKRGVSASRLTSDGKGFEEPISDNNTLNGRYLNRRVEIELSK